MKARDLTYAGETLSSHGFMIGGFDDTPAGDSITTDSQRSFATVSMFYGAYQPFVYTSYEDRLVMEFSIIKEACGDDGKIAQQEDFVLTQSEIRSMKKWLSRPTPHKLTFDEDKYRGVFWEGSFNVEEIYLMGETVGLKLTFESNRPFALADEVSYSGELITGGRFIIDDTSDEEGHIYPSLTVTCLESGDLQLYNSIESRTTIVKNCKVGEVITFTPTLQVRTSLTSHEIGDDFNYKFLRIANTYNDYRNIITTTIPIQYTLSYNPIAKVVVA